MTAAEVKQLSRLARWRERWQGIRQAAKTDLGLSVTGIAGPGGGSEQKPVGLVYMALASSQGVKTTEHRFLGDREQIRARAAQMALDMVRRHLIA